MQEHLNIAIQNLYAEQFDVWTRKSRGITGIRSNIISHQKIFTTLNPITCQNLDIFHTFT